MNIKNIYFISNSITPIKDSFGGNIIIYRHLKRLENSGYKIFIINTLKKNFNKHEFEEINISEEFKIPLRRNCSLLKKLRLLLDLFIIKKRIIKENSIIISLLEDYSSLLSKYISVKLNIPLYLIYHDDNVFDEIYSKGSLIKISEAKAILKSSKHTFAVSTPMIELLKNNGAKSTSILYPIPEGTIDKMGERNSNRNIYHIGTLNENFHKEILNKISLIGLNFKYNFKIITNNLSSETEKKLSNNGSTIIKPIKKTTDLFNKLVSEADLLIVFYSSDLNLERRSIYSFPSKFIELTHLLIPIIIISPKESAISKWCISNKWLTYIDNVDHLPKLLDKLKEDVFWKQCQFQCKNISNTIFNPINIHNSFLNKISES